VTMESKETEVEADPKVGRRYVLAAVALLVTVDLVVLVGYLARIGTDRLPQQLVRLLLLLGLCWALLRGRQWARWLTVVLLFGGLWVGMGVLGQPGAFGRERLPGTLGMLTLYVGYGIVARGLIWSASVRAFFRNRRADDPPPTPAA
jgi:hypothetical protein